MSPKPWAERAPRVLYSSSPDRGLDVLLEIWPRVLEHVPDALAAYAYPGVYDAVADQDPAVAEHRERIRKMAKDLPHVERLGSLSQPDLAALMCDTRVWVHPSWVTMANAPFFETSCIGAMEAQAAGCCVVASGWGALPETVRVGMLVPGPGGTDKWKDGLVAGIVEGLTDERTGNAAVERGPEAVKDLGWDGVAAQVAGLIADDATAQK
jgi:glycosyltransferase involved in cell wall biosynthesis